MGQTADFGGGFAGLEEQGFFTRPGQDEVNLGAFFAQLRQKTQAVNCAACSRDSDDDNHTILFWGIRSPVPYLEQKAGLYAAALCQKKYPAVSPSLRFRT